MSQDWANVVNLAFWAGSMFFGILITLQTAVLIAVLGGRNE